MAQSAEGSYKELTKRIDDLRVETAKRIDDLRSKTHRGMDTLKNAALSLAEPPTPGRTGRFSTAADPHPAPPRPSSERIL